MICGFELLGSETLLCLIWCSLLVFVIETV